MSSLCLCLFSSCTYFKPICHQSINMPETLHPFHIAFWLLHYLSAALWVVKSHTKNMVPVSIIRHGEEGTKRRRGGTYTRKWCKGGCNGTVTWNLCNIKKSWQRVRWLRVTCHLGRCVSIPRIRSDSQRSVGVWREPGTGLELARHGRESSSGSIISRRPLTSSPSTPLQTLTAFLGVARWATGKHS